MLLISKERDYWDNLVDASADKELVYRRDERVERVDMRSAPDEARKLASNAMFWKSFHGDWDWRDWRDCELRFHGLYVFGNACGVSWSMEGRRRAVPFGKSVVLPMEERMRGSPVRWFFDEQGFFEGLDGIGLRRKAKERILAAARERVPRGRLRAAVSCALVVRDWLRDAYPRVPVLSFHPGHDESRVRLDCLLRRIGVSKRWTAEAVAQEVEAFVGNQARPDPGVVVVSDGSLAAKRGHDGAHSFRTPPGSRPSRKARKRSGG